MNRHAVEHELTEQAKAAAGIMEVLRARDMDDDADLVLDTVEGETGFLEAIDQALVEIDACAIIELGCKAVASSINDRCKRAKDRRERVRAALEQALLIADVREKIVRPTATLTMKKIKPGWVVDDESQIPAAYFDPQPPKLAKKRINEHSTSINLPGCHVDNGSVALTIRRK